MLQTMKELNIVKNPYRLSEVEVENKLEALQADFEVLKNTIY